MATKLASQRVRMSSSKCWIFVVRGLLLAVSLSFVAAEDDQVRKHGVLTQSTGGMSRRSFPSNFLFGSASSAFQVCLLCLCHCSAVTYSTVQRTHGTHLAYGIEQSMRMRACFYVIRNDLMESWRRSMKVRRVKAVEVPPFGTHIPTFQV